MEDVGDEDSYAGYKADMTGDTVSGAFDFKELATGGSAAYGDQGKRKGDNRKEEDHEGTRRFSSGAKTALFSWGGCWVG